MSGWRHAEVWYVAWTRAARSEGGISSGEMKRERTSMLSSGKDFWAQVFCQLAGSSGIEVGM